jgi:hypothetical protein
MLKKISAGTIGILSFISINAQDSSKATTPPAATTTFTYSVDAYYRSDFAGQLTNNKTSFTNSINSFELGMASVKVDHSFGKVAATLDLGFGRRANEFSYNDAGAMQSIKQAYISYAASSKVKFTIGKWATHIGYELLDAYANRNYSMSYGFSYGPFFHTGVKADISLGGKSALMLGVANPTDYTSTTSSVKMFLAQFSTGTKDDKLKAWLNYQGGTDKSQFDLVLNGVLSSKFGINYDGTVANIAGTTWSSNALYFNYDPTSKFGMTLRGEYFDNTKKAALTDYWGNNLETSVFAATLSGNIHLDNLTIIPEFRLDNAKDKIFLDKDGKITGGSGSFLIAAVYKF